MLDCGLWGLNPRGHHLTSLLLHAATAVLLFVLLDGTTRETWKSAAVAALFALHPLHVESVAWVAERKDVLSGLFWALTLLAYARHAAVPGAARYALVLVLFVLGLSAKPTLVTLPIVLLLLDHWPLRRTEPLRRLVAEKVPLLALAAASSVLTLLVQRAGGAFGSMEQYPLAARAGNALVAYVTYLAKTLWPGRLAVFYPHPGTGLRAFMVLGAAAILVAATLLALRARRARPYLTVGWVWYLVTLVPVIGLVQVGEQSMADRYTYLPLVGIFLMLTWGATDALNLLAPRASLLRAAWPKVVLGALGALAILTFEQTRIWRNSVTLFEHALAVTEDNHVAHLNLGLAFEEKGDLPRAEEQYRRVLDLRGDHPTAHHNLGDILARRGRTLEAIQHYRAALAADADYADAHDSLGVALATEGRADEAATHFAAAIRLDPDQASFRYNWGTALASAKRWPEAIAQFREAIRLRPAYAEAHHNLAAALYFQGDYVGAWREVERSRAYGYPTPPAFLELLSGRMPEPKRPESRR